MTNRLGVVPTRSSAVADADAPALVLGSASPRRAALLESLGVPFVVSVVEIDEHAVLEAAPAVSKLAGRDAVTLIAAAKFAAFDGVPKAAQLVLTADTLVECDGLVMGKPRNPEQVKSMLRGMSEQTLEISTATCLGLTGSTPTPVTVTTQVTLGPLTQGEIERYAATGVGVDKAAGLALQSDANGFIASVRGCWSNVVGLPLCAVAEALNLEPRGTSRSDRCSVAFCGSG